VVPIFAAGHSCKRDGVDLSEALPWLNKGFKMFGFPHSAPPSVTRVTSVLPHSSGELLLLGTEGGHVFVVEVPGFRELEERNISLDQVANRWAAPGVR